MIRLVRKYAVKGGVLAFLSDERIVWAFDNVCLCVFSG